jgi:hypothetical protein
MKYAILSIGLGFGFSCAAPTNALDQGPRRQVQAVEIAAAEPELAAGDEEHSFENPYLANQGPVNPFLPDVAVDPGAEPMSVISCGDAIIRIGKPYHVCCGKGCHQCKVTPGPGCVGNCCAPAIRASHNVPQCSGGYVAATVPCKLPIPPN